MTVISSLKTSVIREKVPTQKTQSVEGSLVDRASLPGGANPRNSRYILYTYLYKIQRELENEITSNGIVSATKINALVGFCRVCHQKTDSRIRESKMTNRGGALSPIRQLYIKTHTAH